MSDDKYSQLSSYYKSQYDSDDDLDADSKKKIADASSSADADQARQKGWDNAGAYPKLNRMVKAMWYGDKHGSDE